MAAVILPFSPGADRQERSPAPELAPPMQGRMTLERDGGFAPPASTRRVPAEAILAIGRRLRRTASLPVEPVPQEAGPARARMPRKHKLMLLTAAGEAQAYESADEGEVSDIREAIEAAMTAR